MLTFDRPWNDCRLEYFLESLNETLTKIQLTTLTIAFPPWRIDRRPSICQLAQPTLPCSMPFEQLILVCFKQLFYPFLDFIFKYRLANVLLSMRSAKQNIK